MENINQSAKGVNITQNQTNNYNFAIMDISKFEEKISQEIISQIFVYNKERIKELLIEIIKEIEPEKRCFPNKRIFIPTIQQLSYSMDDDLLKETYANLLKSSMNTDMTNEVHPSFVYIISQLTSDEIKLLSILPELSAEYLPLINLRMLFDDPTVNGTLLVSNFTDISYGICDFPDNVSWYIENLERLKLIEISERLKITDDKKYELLKKHKYVQDCMKEYTQAYKQEYNQSNVNFDFDENVFHITKIGELFLRCCKPNQNIRIK